MVTIKRLNNAIDKLEFDATLVLAPEEILWALKTARQSLINAEITARDNALKANACLERAGVLTPRERHEADMLFVTDHWTQQNMQAALYPIGSFCPEILAERLNNLKWEVCDGKEGRPLNPGNWVRVE